MDVSMMDEARNQEVGSRCIICPHCNELVSKSTFYRHRDQFFDQLSNEWRTVKNTAGAAYDKPSGTVDIFIARTHYAYG